MNKIYAALAIGLAYVGLPLLAAAEESKKPVIEHNDQEWSCSIARDLNSYLILAQTPPEGPEETTVIYSVILDHEAEKAMRITAVSASDLETEVSEKDITDIAEKCIEEDVKIRKDKKRIKDLLKEEIVA